MKINKYTALKYLAKHLVKKFGASETQIDLHSIATSLSIMLNVHTPQLKKAGILDEEERVDVNLLDEKVKQLFLYIPSLSFPIGTSTITISKQEVFSLIEDLKKNCDVEEVIYLPNN